MPLLLLFAALHAVSPLAAQEPRELRGVARQVEAAMALFKTPGLAVAVVRDTTVLWARGFGVREVGRPEPVTARTVFAIGSSSKAFTATVMAMLADSGLVGWEERVIDRYPAFRLADPYATRELRVRDLLSHRSGLARGDLSWYGSGADRATLARRAQYLQPTWSLRDRFGYQNLMYVVAGELQQAVSGRTWDDLVRTRLFAPLGMRDAGTTTAERNAAAEVAVPHVEVDDVMRPVPWRDIDNAGPAGSIVAHVTDMARWLRFQLDSGVAGGTRLVSWANLRATRTPIMVVPRAPLAERQDPFTHLATYGMGWFQYDYRGRLVVEHGGNIDGMSALVTFLPHERIGLVVLTNQGSSPLPALTRRLVLDRVLGAPPFDWAATWKRLADSTRTVADSVTRARIDARVAGTRPGHPLAAFAGTYADSLYGQVTVRVERDTLRLIGYGGRPSYTLEHWHHDTFRLWADDWSRSARDLLLARFATASDGTVTELVVEAPGLVAEERRPFGRVGEAGRR